MKKRIRLISLLTPIILILTVALSSCNGIKPKLDPVWTFKNEHIGGVHDCYLIDVVKNNDDHMSVNLRYNIPELEIFEKEWASITFYVNDEIVVSGDLDFKIKCLNSHPNDWMWNSYEQDMYFVTEISNLINIPEQFSTEFTFELFSTKQEKYWYKYLEVNVSKFTE